MNDEEWATCKVCKAKDGVNRAFVYDGKCSVCREIEDNNFDFKQAQVEGKIRRDNTIMCPYCGYVKRDDCYEYAKDTSFDCPKCEKTSNMDVEYTVHFTTSKQKE